MYASLRRRAPELSPEGYGILFVGLICFVKQEKKRRKQRLALFPDGTALPNIVPHSPAIVVDPAAVVAATGWPDNEFDSELRQMGIFELPRCTLDITGASSGGVFSTRQHDTFIPRLKAADATADIDPDTANAVVRFSFNSGKLEAFLTPEPNPDDPTDAAVISRLTVKHADEIKVTVNGTAAKRTLRLKPGSEIALANVVLRDEGLEGDDHFSIYGQLTVNGTITGAPPKPDPDTPPLLVEHPIFTLIDPVQDGGVNCGNTGCC